GTLLLLDLLRRIRLFAAQCRSATSPQARGSLPSRLPLFSLPAGISARATRDRKDGSSSWRCEASGAVFHVARIQLEGAKGAEEVPRSSGASWSRSLAPSTGRHSHADPG